MESILSNTDFWVALSAVIAAAAANNCLSGNAGSRRKTRKGEGRRHDKNYNEG